MNATEAFEAWAPPESPWSVWAKPVLFADDTVASISVGLYPPTPGAPVPPPGHLPWAPAASGQTALVLDLPGEQAVLFGLALARSGYRPVPVFNGAAGPSPVVPVAGPVRRLFEAAPELMTLPIPPAAPPVFLLDSLRSSDSQTPCLGQFDNRWIVFPEDFPSANFLRSRGIGCVLLVQEMAGEPRTDLAHVLLRWQEGCLALTTFGVHGLGPLQPLTVSRPSAFRRLWYRAMVLAGLRRHSGGGFGAMVPEDAENGGG